MPDLRIDAVEIDPVVVEAAERFFGVQEDERFKIHVTDGAEFILKTRAVYDLVLIDAYSGEGIPQALASASFFDAVKAKTSAEGVVILNLFNLKAKERRLLQTFSMRFPKIVITSYSIHYTKLYERSPAPGGSLRRCRHR